MAADWSATCCCRLGSPNYAGLVPQLHGRITTLTTRRENGDWLSSGPRNAVVEASTSIWPMIWSPTTASLPARNSHWCPQPAAALWMGMDALRERVYATEALFGRERMTVGPVPYGAGSGRTARGFPNRIETKGGAGKSR